MVAWLVAHNAGVVLMVAPLALLAWLIEEALFQ